MRRQDKISLALRIVSLIVALIITIVAFYIFLSNTNLVIKKQNRDYLSSYTISKVNNIETVFAAGISEAQQIAHIYACYMDLDDNLVYYNELKDICFGSEFDFVGFVDKNGVCYTDDDVRYYVVGTDYYQKGIQGESGVDFERRIEIDNKKYLIFYAPIMVDGDLKGLIIGGKNSESLNGILSGKIYSFDSECVIIDNNMNIISGTKGVSEVYNNMEVLMDRMKVEDEQKKTFLNVLRDGMTDYVEVSSGDDKELVFVARLKYNDWKLIQNFPKEASKTVSSETHYVGFILMLQLVITFIIYILGVALYHLIRYKVTRKENLNAEYIFKGTGRMFAKFALLDFKEGTYEYLKTNPTDTTVSKKGPFNELFEYFDRMIIDEKMREAFRVTFEPQNLLKRLEHDDRVFNYSLHLMNPSEYWDTISVMAIEWENEKVTKALVVNQHVTDMKKREERDKIALQNALTSAQEANKAKSAFLSNVSHDIRTPMNAIVGFSTLLNRDADNPGKVREYTKKITAASQHLLGIINDVLDMSKIESGKAVLNNEEFNFNDLIEEIKDMIVPQMEEKNKDFTLNIHDIKNFSLKGDKVRINQILLNLLSNAIKYTGQDGVISLDIYEQSTAQDDKYANMKFIVEDNGIGMDKEFKLHIFESFTREINSVTNKIQGTGLGMAISKSLVDMMNGTIEVESEKYKGSTFTVTIPIEIVENDVPEFDVDKHLEENEDVLKGMKFLVAEDNEVNYMVISSLLEMKGASSIQAINGQDAVLLFKKACKGDFDMIFMDVQMPVMNGYDATRAIREIDNPWAKEIPIIAMTANAYAEDVANALNSGMNAHIAKPIDMNILMSTVKRFKK